MYYCTAGCIPVIEKASHTLAGWSQSSAVGRDTTSNATVHILTRCEAGGLFPLGVAELRRRFQHEQHDLLACECADVVVQAHNLEQLRIAEVRSAPTLPVDSLPRRAALRNPLLSARSANAAAQRDLGNRSKQRSILRLVRAADASHQVSASAVDSRYSEAADVTTTPASVTR